MPGTRKKFDDRILALLCTDRTASRRPLLPSPWTRQDLMTCAVLSETVYKVVDLKPAEVLECLQDLSASLPPGLCTLRAVQWALPHVQHRSVV